MAAPTKIVPKTPTEINKKNLYQCSGSGGIRILSPIRLQTLKPRIRIVSFVPNLTQKVPTKIDTNPIYV